MSKLNLLTLQLLILHIVIIGIIFTIFSDSDTEKIITQQEMIPSELIDTSGRVDELPLFQASLKQ